MLILDDHQLIIMMPQKCGTSTIEMRLSSLHNESVRPRASYYEPKLRKYVSKHVTLKDASKLGFSRKREHYDKACFVRNPYERVYSWFLWQVRRLETALPERGREDPAVDATAITVGASAEEQHMHRIFSRLKLKMDSVGWNFSRYLEKSPKTNKPISKFTHRRFRNRMNFIGYVERFEVDYLDLLQRYQIPVTSEMTTNTSAVPRLECDPHSMNAQDYRYLKFYDQASIAIVNRLLKKDFKYFGYEMLNPRDFPVTQG
jgi:hypothetical protein